MRPLLLIVFLLAAAGPCAQHDVAPPVRPAAGDTLVVKGTLTDEGVECPAMRDAKGALYTLAGPLGGFHQGDAVCVRGRRAEVSHCMQGITLTVDWIGPASACP